MSGNPGTPNAVGAATARAGVAARRTQTPAVSRRLPWARLRAYWLAPQGIVMLAATLLALAIRVFTLTRPGYITGVTEYDDGVYLGGAIRLLQGALPYQNWAFVQPPGILLLMSPVALIAKVGTATDAMAAARVLTALASTACVPMAGSLLRYRGTFVTLVTCGALAIYPDDITTAHTLILEPWMNLFLLLGACLAFRRGHLASTQRLLWAGVAIGFAGAVKYWAALPAVALLVLCVVTGPAAGRGAWHSALRVRRAACYAGGVLAGFLVPVLPFAVTAPSVFVRSTLFDQAARAGTSVPQSLRLAHITGLIDFLSSTGHLSLDAGVHSLFANGGAAATSTTGAGWLPFAVALVGVAVIAIGYCWNAGRMSPLEWFALVSAALAIAAVLSYSAFFYHYPDFAAPWLALTVGAVAGSLAHEVAEWTRARRVVIAGTGVVILALAVFQASEVSGLRAPDISADATAIPAGACLVTDQTSLAIAADRFTAARPGCPDIMDALAATLVLSNGVSVQGGAADLPDVVAAWKKTFSEAQYVWLSPNNARRIPWTPALQLWFITHFQLLQSPGPDGLGHVYEQVSLNG